MRAVSRYGATTLTGRMCGPLEDAGVVDHRVDRAQPVDLIGHCPGLVEVGQVSDDG